MLDYNCQSLRGVCAKIGVREGFILCYATEFGVWRLGNTKGKVVLLSLNSSNNENKDYIKDRLEKPKKFFKLLEYRRKLLCSLFYLFLETIDF